MQITENIFISVGANNATCTVDRWDYTTSELEISINIFPLLNYQPLGVDFGPLDLATTCRFSRFLGNLLIGKKKVELAVPQSKISDRHFTNLLVLVLAYLVMAEISSPKETRNLLARIRKSGNPPLVPFVCPLANKFPTSAFQLQVEDVLEALLFAKSQGWLELENLDPEKIEFFQHPDHGDLNAVVPGKFVAFAGPSSFPGEGLTPASLVPKLRNFGVSTVVRLNHPRYAAEDFRSAGFSHHDLIFPDGSCPEQDVLHKFMEISETSEGVLAVHCKAGLGRTGTLIAFWLMRNFRVSARVAIGWLRLARPGSVLGPQQQFLEELSLNLAQRKPSTAELRKGDRGQGGRLLKRKRTNS